MTALKVCHFCAGCPRDGAAFPPRKTRSKPRICLDCAKSPTARPEAGLRTKPITRASYRAAHRRRSELAQTDLVDLLVPCP